MYRIKRALLLLLPAALLAAGLSPAASATALAGTPATAGVTKHTGKFQDGATYLIQVPSNWNGTLFLYSHGYVVPGSREPRGGCRRPDHRCLDAQARLRAGRVVLREHRLGISTCAAGPDPHPQRLRQDRRKPTRTIAWGHSLGGMITAGLVQRYPARFNGALPMCGVVSGALATWNTTLDSEFAFQQLIDPSVSVVNITNPGPTWLGADGSDASAQETAKGRARLALSAALADVPGWFTPLHAAARGHRLRGPGSQPVPLGQQVDFPFAFALRADVEARRAGTVVERRRQLLKDLLNSADLKEVLALYHGGAPEPVQGPGHPRRRPADSRPIRRPRPTSRRTSPTTGS